MSCFETKGKVSVISVFLFQNNKNKLLIKLRYKKQKYDNGETYLEWSMYCSEGKNSLATTFVPTGWPIAAP